MYYSSQIDSTMQKNMKAISFVQQIISSYLVSIFEFWTNLTKHNLGKLFVEIKCQYSYYTSQHYAMFHYKTNKILLILKTNVLIIVWQHLLFKYNIILFLRYVMILNVIYVECISLRLAATFLIIFQYVT